MSLAQQIALLDRAQAVRRLQAAGEHLRASLLHNSKYHELQRLRGDLESNAALTGNQRNNLTHAIRNLAGELDAHPRNVQGPWTAAPAPRLAKPKRKAKKTKK
jgi:hypothetical protein